MTSKPLDRRNFIKLSSLLLAGVPLAPTSSATAQTAAQLTGSGGTENSAQSGDPLETPLQWLEQSAPASFKGATWGVPWPRGHMPAGAAFELAATDGGARLPVQSWPLAYWPDGSLKWSAHALGADTAPQAAYRLIRATESGAQPIKLVRESARGWRVDTGPLQCELGRSGTALFDTLSRNGKPLARDGHLLVLTDDKRDGESDDESAGAVRRRYRSAIGQVVVEQNGTQRAVVKISGTHRLDSTKEGGARESLLPFVLRLYFYKGSDNVRVVHSLVSDIDPARDTIRGVGLRFSVPLATPLYDRHVRFVGDNGGVFAESVRGLTGLRRDPGAAVTSAQLAGRATPPVSEFAPAVAQALGYIPAFGDYSLLQAHPDGFSISKRTGKGSGWIHAASGGRAAGTAYLGTPEGGVAFGIRNFWQSYPGQIDIGNAAQESGSASPAAVTLWLWAPQAPGMDLRFYHNGLGQDTYKRQREGLDITYEDYEPGFGTAYGVGRTSEIELQLLAATPSAEELVRIARRIETPPQLVASPERLYRGEAFSEFWRPQAATPSPAAANLQKQLAWAFDYYKNQVAERKWYGFWDYGDVMHTYDAQRHVWRYDVGGFAWDNSELSTEIWLWHYFLHSGRADAYRMAEAMTRHTSEVDVHHIGPFSPLGSRHNVQHWGDSAKQLRVSTAINRRFMYYLAADERIGELLTEQVDAVNRLRDIEPGRKLDNAEAPLPDRDHARVSFGTDWGAVSAAWFTQWERTGKPEYRDKLAASMASIAAQPHGFFTGAGVMDLRTGAFAIDTGGKISVSHLSAVFGLAEICSELIRALPQPAFRQAWLDYCRLYSATPEQQKAALGQSLVKLNLGQGHARLLGYAGLQQQDSAERAQAWSIFFQGRAGLIDSDMVTRKVRVPEVLADIDEAPEISTNAVAQWGLGALGLLAVAPEELEQSTTDKKQRPSRAARKQGEKTS